MGLLFILVYTIGLEKPIYGEQDLKKSNSNGSQGHLMATYRIVKSILPNSCNFIYHPLVPRYITDCIQRDYFVNNLL